MLNEIFISESSEKTGPLVLFVMFAVEFLSPQEGLLLLILLLMMLVLLLLIIVSLKLFPMFSL